jgi:hypothetical protein
MKTILRLTFLILLTITFTASLISIAQAQGQRNRIEIQGTPGADVITVNDAAGVICGSRGFSAKGAALKNNARARILDAPDARCPGSDKSFSMWTFDGTAENYFTGNFGAGDDRYIRIDGPGNDRYEYDAGEGNDVISSTDGPGNDDYIYNNGAGNDLSVHVNAGPEAGGRDRYLINAGPGTDRIEMSDGPGDDVFDFRNAESVGFTDYYFWDKDTFTFTRDEKEGFPAEGNLGSVDRPESIPYNEELRRFRGGHKRMRGSSFSKLASSRVR